MGREPDFAGTLARPAAPVRTATPHHRAKRLVPGRLAQLGERLPYKCYLPSLRIPPCGFLEPNMLSSPITPRDLIRRIWRDFGRESQVPCPMTPEKI